VVSPLTRISFTLAQRAPLKLGVLTPNATGHRDLTRRDDPFEPRRHVHPIDKDIAISDDDASQMDTDPEFDPAIPRHSLISLAHAALDSGRAGDGIHHTWELGQHAVPCELDNAAPGLGDFKLNQLSLVALEPSERAGLVRPMRRL
jgi:hypothetical protein